MFEKWFGGNNKKEVKPSVEGVAHFDEGVLEEEKFDDKLDQIQTDFSLKDGKQFKKDQTGRSWHLYDDPRDGVRGKVSNERNKDKITELHSDWKEKAIFDEPLSKEEISDEHLDALMEQEQNTKFARDNFYPEEYDEDEDQDLEKAA